MAPDLASPNGAALADLVTAVARDLATRTDELNRLDAVAGDGDLGLTIAAASAALLELAPALLDVPESEAIRSCGTELARRAPSTGGTLIAFALLGAARAEVPAGAGGRARALGYLEAATRTIADRGRVERGDRTMLDGLAPAVDALRVAIDSGRSARDAAAEAASAADAGARATAAMAATVGRAGWLAGRAEGHEDAGARLVAMAFAAAAAHVEQLPEG
jgi:phosphoenolpyruvate---glycerone phosphotransferase subunit DhaL